MSQYPLYIKFKILAIASQFQLTDSAGNMIFYSKQKLLKLKENIEIYSDKTKNELLYTINADRVIDYSPEFSITNNEGQKIGSIKRHGGKSITKASYTVYDKKGKEAYFIEESNPWTKVADYIVSNLPFIGFISAFLFHPVYEISSNDNVILTLTKKPAFFEGKYQINKKSDNYNQQHQDLLNCAMTVVVLRERIRG